MVLETGKKVNTGYLDLTKLVMSGAVLLHFLSIILVNQKSGTVTSAFYYLAILIGVVVYFGRSRSIRFRPIILLAMGAGLLTGLNTAFVGNETVIRSLVLVAAFFVAALMLDDAVDERTFLIALYLNVAVVIAHIVLRGTNAPVYDGSSNNYVSIHLLAPGLLYYSLLDARGKKIPIVPAVVIWVLCFLSGGRGGFLAGTILLAGVLLRNYLGEKKGRRDKVLLGFLLVVILIPVLIIVVWAVFSQETDNYMINRFLDRGLDGGRRIPAWIEYIESMGKSLKSFFLGVDLDTQVLIQKYSGNLHNSFLFVHAYMGIFGFVAMLILILRAVVRAIRSGRGVYLCCILTLCFRGMTDHMFGGNRLSAIAIAILLVTEVIRDKNEDPKDLMVRGVMK